VDGNRDAVFYDGSCSSTDAVHQTTWWAVDLGQPTYVDHVTITNRADCCAERLSDFWIEGSNISPSNYLTQSSQGPFQVTFYSGYPPAGIPTNISLDNYNEPGRYLYISVERAEYLTICELEVYSV